MKEGFQLKHNLLRFLSKPILKIMLVVAALIVGFYLGVRYQQLQPPLVKYVTKVPVQDNLVPGYEKRSELSADLRGDGQKDLVQIYDQANNIQNCPILPVVIRIFSKNGQNLKDQYTFTFGQDNGFSSADVIPSLWGDSRQVVVIETVSTGCGSGYHADLNFIRAAKTSATYNQGYYYDDVPGPKFGELDSYIIDTGGGKITLARGIWAADEGHFDTHRYHLELYTWSAVEEKFVKTDLGTTKNKYGSVSTSSNSTQANLVDTILAAEPGVLKPKQVYK